MPSVIGAHGDIPGFIYGIPPRDMGRPRHRRHAEIYHGVHCLVRVATGLTADNADITARMLQPGCESFRSHMDIDRFYPGYPAAFPACLRWCSPPPCPGHGCKFCSVMGEILAVPATGDGTTRHDIGVLRLGRPGLVA